MKTSSAAGVVNLFGLVGRLADATGYRRYDWTGAVDSSTSTVSDSTGNVMLTNLVTNPRSVASGAMVEVARNYHPSPRGTTNSGLSTWGGTGGAASSTPNTPTDGPIPEITTCRRTTWTTAATVKGGVMVSQHGPANGINLEVPVLVSGWIRVSQTVTIDPQAQAYLNSAPVSIPDFLRTEDNVSAPASFTLQAGAWTPFKYRVNLQAAANQYELRFYASTSTPQPLGQQFDITGVVTTLVDATNTNFFDGSYSPDPDLTPRWLGSVNDSASVLEGKAVTGVAQNAAAHIIQSSWVPEGQTGHSIRVIPKSATADAYASLSTAGVASAATASVVVRLTAPQTGTMSSPSSARGIYWSGSWLPRVQAPNEPGETTLTLVHPNRTGVLGLYNGARLGGGDVWFYLPTVVNGAHPDLDPFHGSMPSEAPGSAPLTEWVGGQGNSGCRFVGSPTYIENTGVNGGQISYAASFKEVGDWQ